jgi:predicted DsbA family dithiol-disulfide isomerase
VRMSLSLRVDVVSDIVCPWCYIGSKRLKQLLASETASVFAGRVEVFWHPYRLLPPSFPPVNKARFYEDRFGSQGFQRARAHVQKEGSTCGITFNYDEKSMLGPTTDAHRLVAWVPRDKQQALVDALFLSYHEEGRLISDFETLAACAAECGINKEDTIEFLKSGKLRPELEDELLVAPEKFNMAGGVPHFVLNIKGGSNDVKTIISGGQSLEYFQIVLARALSKARPQIEGS